MANNLYKLSVIGATIRSQKSLAAIFNGTGSGKQLKIYEIMLLNNQSVAITGVLARFELRLITAISGGGLITSLKYNTGIADLPSSIITAEGAVVTNSSVLRRVLWSTDEPAASTSTVDEFELIPFFNTIYSVPIGNAQGVEPITLNEGQGITLNNTTVTNVGQVDIFIKFTAS